jgi:hypothetical protein
MRLDAAADAREESLDLPESGESGGRMQPQWPVPGDSTADESVDAIISNLAGIPDLPVRGHQQVYQQIHDDLLAELETEAD